MIDPDDIGVPRGDRVDHDIGMRAAGGSEVCAEVPMRYLSERSWTRCSTVAEFLDTGDDYEAAFARPAAQPGDHRFDEQVHGHRIRDDPATTPSYSPSSPLGCASIAACDTAALPPNTSRSTVSFASRAASRKAAVSAGIWRGSASTSGAHSRSSSGAALIESNGTRARAPSRSCRSRNRSHPRSALSGR